LFQGAELVAAQRLFGEVVVLYAQGEESEGSGSRVSLGLQLLLKFILFPGSGLNRLHEFGVFLERARRAELHLFIFLVGLSRSAAGDS
jgi:hypothetical protein